MSFERAQRSSARRGSSASIACIDARARAPGGRSRSPSRGSRDVFLDLRGAVRAAPSSRAARGRCRLALVGLDQLGKSCCPRGWPGSGRGVEIAGRDLEHALVGLDRGVWRARSAGSAPGGSGCRLRAPRRNCGRTSSYRLTSRPLAERCARGARGAWRVSSGRILAQARA